MSSLFLNFFQVFLPVLSKPFANQAKAETFPLDLAFFLRICLLFYKMWQALSFLIMRLFLATGGVYLLRNRLSYLKKTYAWGRMFSPSWKGHAKIFSEFENRTCILKMDYV